MIAQSPSPCCRVSRVPCAVRRVHCNVPVPASTSLNVSALLKAAITRSGMDAPTTAASGLSDSPPRPIFGADTITLQLVTRMSLTLSGALLGLLETSERAADEKNRLCPPTVWPHTPFDYLRVILAGIRTETGWQNAPELQEFVDHSRLNLTSGLSATNDRAGTAELQRRFFAALFPALDTLRVFAQQATPQERARIFETPVNPGD